MKTTQTDYASFIRAKKPESKSHGFKPTLPMNRHLFDWQRRVVEWAIRRGRAALFEECGLGKSLQQLEWSRHIWAKTKRPVVIHCPVAVREQTRREAEKFEIAAPIAVVDDQGEVINGLNLINYEKMHKFDASIFGGVVLDESSVLKNFVGKTKRQLCDAYSHTQYRLACTATPAPNDYMELGNHSDFLGILKSNEMLSRWFINDTMKAGGYRLRRHGEGDFWEWVASWAVCIGTPSDIGGDDEGYTLPGLQVHEHVVDVQPEAPDGLLYAIDSVNATSIHREKRASATARAAKVLELVEKRVDPQIVWCDSNYEADAIVEEINGESFVEVRGDHSEKEKESAILAFINGTKRILVTKPEIAGFGLNLQHCNSAIFVGLSYSFERYYQAVRRTYRFGQKRPVTIDVITTPAERVAAKAVWAKQDQHKLMQSGMAAAMRGASLVNLGVDVRRREYQPTTNMVKPSWLARKESTCEC